jgi:hypothetical protein
MGTSSRIEQGQRKLLFSRPDFQNIRIFAKIPDIFPKICDKNGKFLIFLQNYLHILIKSSTFALEMKS